LFKTDRENFEEQEIMCGIFGYTGSEKLEKLFFETMKHRGPDARGIKKSNNLTLGHLRLSIIDLNLCSNQPFEKDGSILVFNGEIYNYLELQKKYLSKDCLNTRSDTEVLITLLNKFGIDILNELNGMFAFAYLNKKQELFLVRDRFGVKPLYYTQVDEKLYFSSELKPLLFVNPNNNLDESIIKSFFDDTATDFDERSGYININSIKPGHYILMKNNKIYEQSGWYFGFDKKRLYGNSKQLIQECEDILLDAIKIRCRSDVPIAITLSGGTDSTVIYSLIKEKLKIDIKPFIFKHENIETDESTLAISLAKKYGDDPVIVQQSTSPLEDLKEALWYLELPVWSPSVIAYLSTYRKIAKMGYKVVIEGHGADEQLGGYPYMIQSSAIEALQNYNFKDYILRKKIQLETLHRGLMQKPNKLGLIRSYVSDLKQLVFGEKADFNLTLNKSFDYKILPIVLRTFDRLSMSCSLESRMPFMDYRFVEFTRKLPVSMKISKMGSKSILREILKKYKNEEIYLNKKKMGFASDLTVIFNDKDFKKFIFKLVEEFDFESFLKNKNKAMLLYNHNISWHNYSEIWKVASVSYYLNFKKLISKLN
jgi:asparagine synthase (glutamine-hydrolysing)